MPCLSATARPPDLPRSHGCGELSSALRRLSKPANSYALEAPLQWRERQKRGDAADGSGDTSDATLPGEPGCRPKLGGW